MKWNESGINSLEIVIYVIVVLACLCLLAGVFTEINGVVNENNSIQER